VPRPKRHCLNCGFYGLIRTKHEFGPKETTLTSSFLTTTAASDRMPPSRTTTRLSTRSNPVRAARPVKYDKDHLPRLLRPHPKDLEDLLNGDFKVSVPLTRVVPFLINTDARKIPALVESSYITQALESSRLLFKSTEVLKCRPPPPYFGPNVPKQESTKKGKVICAPHEEELMRLENIIRPYQKVCSLNGNCHMVEADSVRAYCLL
jgi:hypothetical protein